MRFLFDQNISHRILQLLPDNLSIDSTTVKKESLVNASDREIWEYAKANSFVIVTQDSDFNDLYLLYGFPPKIVWFHTGNIKSTELVDILIEYLDEIKKFLIDSDYGCFEIFKRTS